MNKKRIVITGMGLISPCGNTVSEFWNNIINGQSGIGPITKFDTTDFKCKIGGEIKNFDPAIYGINAKEARKMDDFTKYAVAASDMAIRDSKLMLSDYNPRISIIFGVGIGGFRTLENSEIALLNPLNKDKKVSPFTIPMIMPNAAAGEISIRYKIHGPSFSVNAACASALYAIIQSIITIQAGLSDVVITGGSEAVIVPLSYAAFGSMQAITTNNEDPAKASKPFDIKRDGFVISEGAGIIIIEDLEHALSRNATIHGEIIGFGMSSDAYHITAPGNGAQHAMQNALISAKIQPSNIDYINAHGTSTTLNDKMESKAIENLFQHHVGVSSTKSMTGHLLGAAAAIETIACVKTIQEGITPPTINYQNPDPECGNLDYIPNKAKKANVRIAMNNSFGFGGHNACLIIKKYEG